MSNDEMAPKDILENSFHVLEGRPWRDAIISLLEPRSPYRPWTTQDVMRPGDAVLLVLGTDPASVLSAVGTVGPEVDIAGMLSAIPDYRREELLELSTLTMLTPHEEIVATLDDYHWSSAVTLFGHTTLAAARVLLKSGGRCTACHSGLDLADVDARDRIHIRTVDLGAYADGLWDPHVRGDVRDWPAVLCDECHTRMNADGFASLLDFMFASRPRCPECKARRSLIPIYGMPAFPFEEPWVAMMGCSLRSATERQEMADSVFYDLADTPEDAANLTARGLLMIAIEQRIKEKGWTQTEAAARLHVTQPRVSDLLTGKISKFSLDALINMLAPVGLTFDVRPVERPPERAAKKAEETPADRSTQATSNKRAALTAH